MMFLLDAAFAIELIALAFGTGLLIWSMRNQGEGVVLGRFIGYLVFILSVFVLLCTSFYGFIYWAQGKFDSPMNTSMPMSMPMNQEMMQQMMPLMMEKMMEHKGQMGNMGYMGKMEMQKGKDHSHPADKVHP